MEDSKFAEVKEAEKPAQAPLHIKRLFVKCENCDKKYAFGVFNKMRDEFERLYEYGDQCHTCFFDYCGDCLTMMKHRFHSYMDDANLCKYLKCEKDGLMHCPNCMHIPDEFKEIIEKIEKEAKAREQHRSEPQETKSSQNEIEPMPSEALRSIV